MTPEQRAQRIHHHMYETCEGIAEHAERIVALEEENANLRKERDGWHRVAKSKQDILDQMRDARAENAKLRELVRDMHKALFSLNLDHCQACPRNDACVFVHKSFDCDECAFERDMRELGVEV